MFKKTSKSLSRKHEAEIIVEKVSKIRIPIEERIAILSDDMLVRRRLRHGFIPGLNLNEDVEDMEDGSVTSTVENTTTSITEEGTIQETEETLKEEMTSQSSPKPPMPLITPERKQSIRPRLQPVGPIRPIRPMRPIRPQLQQPIQLGSQSQQPIMAGSQPINLIINIDGNSYGRNNVIQTIPVPIPIPQPVIYRPRNKKKSSRFSTYLYDSESSLT